MRKSIIFYHLAVIMIFNVIIIINSGSNRRLQELNDQQQQIVVPKDTIKQKIMGNVKKIKNQFVGVVEIMETR